MLSSKIIRAFFGVAALATTVISAQGCVADRPSRNGVFNENQYVRKDFLIQPGSGATGDPGWFMKATIVQAGTPNPLAPVDLFTGAENSGAIVRFVITQDKMQLADMRELSNNQAINDQNTRTPNIVNAWPITNVDLKYRVNLDGEKTNFYEENQELNWQDRQWVKLDFARNDLSDLAPFYATVNPVVHHCTNMAEASASPIPNSLITDTDN